MVAVASSSSVSMARFGRDGFATVEWLLFPLAVVEALALLVVAGVALTAPERALKNLAGMLIPAGMLVALGAFFTAAYKHFAVGPEFGWQDMALGVAAVVSLLVAAPGAAVLSLLSKDGGP